MYFSRKEKRDRENDEKRTGCGALAKTGRECGIMTPFQTLCIFYELACYHVIGQLDKPIKIKTLYQ